MVHLGRADKYRGAAEISSPRLADEPELASRTLWLSARRGRLQSKPGLPIQLSGSIAPWI